MHTVMSHSPPKTRRLCWSGHIVLDQWCLH